jgi:catechol 2,3-dioxygenase-like lactoylglutathione lyase family enzyme
MIDHVGANVANFETSRAFYVRAVGAIGYGLPMEFPAEARGNSAVADFAYGAFGLSATARSARASPPR